MAAASSRETKALKIVLALTLYIPFHWMGPSQGYSVVSEFGRLSLLMLYRGRLVGMIE